MQLEILLDAARAVDPQTILELGVGSGLVAHQLLSALPLARLIGYDYSDAMLELAQQRLDEHGERFSCVRADLRRASVIPTPQQPIDLVVSVQALHHLTRSEKAGVFRWLGIMMPLGSAFVMRDKVAVPDELFNLYATVWDYFGEELPRSRTAYAERLAENLDRPDSLADHLSWLKQAGYSSGVLHATAHYALFAGVKTE